MKKQNRKWLTTILAGLCVASLGASVASATVQADDSQAVTYAISDVFGGSGVAEADGKNVAFKLGNDENMRLKRDLAFKWYEEKDTAGYLTIKFAFKTLDFTSVTFQVESASSVATKEKKTVNAVKFTVKEGKVYASVINGEEEGVQQLTQIIAGNEVVLALTQGDKFDSFGVTVDGVPLIYGEDENGNPIKAEFTNVGANYADYPNQSLEIKATAAEGKEAVILLNEINGQRFDNVENSKIADTAAPVLVVNEDVNGFQYGTAFALSYEKIDVLQASSLTEEKKYYQYNPADEKASCDTSLTTSTYFMDTVYYTNGTEVSKEAKEGYTATSVISEDGCEYVAIQFTLGDSTFDGVKKDADGNVYEKKVYNLSWYAADTAVEPKTLGTVDTDYIVINTNDEGASYAHITLDDVKKENVTTDLTKQIEAYKALLKEESEKDDTRSGSNADFPIPAVDWLIKDNGGYRNLKFTISYKTPGSSSPKTASSLSYNNLEFSTTEEGLYEFKIFATDKAGNTMKCYLDGKLVDVSTGNIWDIEEIPSFTFEIENKGIKVDSTGASSRKAEKILNETYTLSSMTVIGATNQQSGYELYRLDTTGYNGPAITQTALTNVSYDALTSAAKTLLGQVGTETYPTYFDLYLDIYAGKVAAAINGDKAAVKACFKEIKAYNANITENDPEWEEYNKYNWNASSKSFKTVEEGEYLILADFWEKELPMQRASAYKVVIVETEEDVAEGESKVWAWVKANKVSVILFGVAAIMLILIVVLLLVKPSDETLEDVDKEVEKKKGKKDEE